MLKRVYCERCGSPKGRAHVGSWADRVSAGLCRACRIRAESDAKREHADRKARRREKRLGGPDRPSKRH